MLEVLDEDVLVDDAVFAVLGGLETQGEGRRGRAFVQVHLEVEPVGETLLRFPHDAIAVARGAVVVDVLGMARPGADFDAQVEAAGFDRDDDGTDDLALEAAPEEAMVKDEDAVGAQADGAGGGELHDQHARGRHLHGCAVEAAVGEKTEPAVIRLHPGEQGIVAGLAAVAPGFNGKGDGLLCHDRVLYQRSRDTVEGVPRIESEP